MNPQEAQLAGRYAKALFEAARAAKAVDAVREELRLLARAYRSDGSLARTMSHPRLPAADKRAAVKAVLKKAPHALTERFVSLLLSKKRLALLVPAASAFDVWADGAEGLTRVQVRAAAVLTDAQAKSLAAGLEKALGTKVVFETIVDPSLMGGVVVRAGDRLWDLSLKGRLGRLREKLLQTALN